MRLISQGTSVSAAEAVALGIVDRVAEGDLIVAAVAMAQAPPLAGRAPGLRDGRGYQVAVMQARGVGGSLAPALIDCVEAAQLLPLEQGMDFEAEMAEEVALRPEAAALQHMMASDMRMMADLQGGKPAGRIGLWGAGAGALIWPALRAGIEVVLADDDRAALLNAVEKLALAQEEQVAAGRLTTAARDLEWARLRPAVAAADLQDCAVVFAAKPGAVGRVVQFGTGAEAAAARLVLVGPGLAELQVSAAARVWGQTVAATLRQMRLRLGITQAPPEGGVTRALVMAAQTAVKVLRQMGVAHDAILAALEGVMRLPVPPPDGPEQAPLAMPAPMIRERVLAAVAAESARLLMQGAVRRAGILDALSVVAFGMPRQLGGPLLMADQRGLMLLRRDLLLWQGDHQVWSPPGLLDELVSTGGALAAWQAAR